MSARPILPTSYKEAADEQAKHTSRWGGLLGFATFLVPIGIEGNEPESFGIKHHATVIVEHHKDGRTTLNTNGWRSTTTKARLCAALPRGWGVHQHKRVWFLSFSRSYWGGEHQGTYLGEDSDVYEYEDGLQLVPSKRALGGFVVKRKDGSRLRPCKSTRYTKPEPETKPEPQPEPVP